MAVPNTPTGFILQQGNTDVAASWDITPTALSYKVQRSTDGITYAVVGTPTTPFFLDNTTLVGVVYYYRIIATNSDGDSTPTSALNIVPVVSGNMTLGQIRLMAQQRADRVNSNFVTTTEWNTYINNSAFELYDLLIAAYEDYYLADPVQLTTNGIDQLYPIPNGVNYNEARPLYKLYGVDCGLNNSNNARVTLNKFNFINRNQYVYPQLNSTLLGVFNLRYRLVGENIMFIPIPSAGQVVTLWYYPRMETLLLDTDTFEGINGWCEYVVVDAAIKALQKEESDVSVLMMQKQALLKRIEDNSENRDAGQPDVISNIRRGSEWGQGWGPNGNGVSGGW